jgi:hypothetical protein
MNNPLLAAHIASGLGGWHQLQHVQNLGDLSGEDSARLVLSQIINAQGRFKPAKSQLPPNWGNIKKRVDIALLGRSAGSTTWYGAIEVKWPGTEVAVHAVRQAIAQDVMRLALVKTNVLNAKFLVLGGSTESLTKLFDKAHYSSLGSEFRRYAFTQLLSRQMAAPSCSVPLWSLLSDFPELGERCPPALFATATGNLKTKLLAKSPSIVDGKEVGCVFVWQCNRK